MPIDDDAMSKGVRKIFSQVYPNYELVNHALTLGLDILWRRMAVKEIASIVRGSNWLEVCCGTSEMSVYLSNLASSRHKLVAADFTMAMLRATSQKRKSRHIALTLAESMNLPFPDESFDLVVISFATRNLNRNRELLIKYLKEFHRVIRPGGAFINLETSQPPSSLVRSIFHFHANRLVKLLGRLLSGSKTGYAYLSFTLSRFYGAEDFEQILKESGFSNTSFKRLTFGVAAIHIARR